MTNSFRIEASEMQGWHAALAARMEVRGVAAIAKEVEAHLMKKDAEGFVVVTRHQLFTWAEALHGAAGRSIQGASLEQVVSDMRAILSGKPPAPAPPVHRVGASEGVAASIGRMVAGGPAPGQEIHLGDAPPAARSSPPAVVYGPASSAVGGASGFLVTGAQLGELVRDLVRSARSELLVSSPWDTGIETFHADIVALPPEVRVRIVSRRPAQDTPAFHQALDQLGRRRAVTAFSGHIQTRMIVQDDVRALVGAASVPGPASREAGILLTDRASVAAVKAHLERVHQEAAGPVK